MKLDTPNAFFDRTYDMGDPSGAASHMRRSRKSDGTYMVLEDRETRWAWGTPEKPE